MQLGVVISMSIRWLMLVAMRPFADEVEFLYEFMSVTGEAAVMVMVCLNYFQSVAVPPAAILISSLLIVGGNLGAQVGLLPTRRSPSSRIAYAIGEQVQAIVLGRVLLIGEPLHHKLAARSDVYRRFIGTLMQQWIRSFPLD